MRKEFLTAIMTLLFVQVMLAQGITVENFNHHKHYFWQLNSTLPLDKKNAVVLLKTEQKGFQFKTAMGNPIDSEESDTGIVLRVPDKTKYIVVSHPDFGDYDWRVPTKFLKRNNYYSADLVTTDLTKEYKNPRQWVVFNISPENSILTIDSVMHRVTDGQISLYLPVGKHSYTAESPFYEEFSDSIILTDTARIEKNIFLSPLYSYLKIKAEDPEIEIYVDDHPAGTNEVAIGRLAEGIHRVSLLRNNIWVKDTIISLAQTEKKTIVIPKDLNSNNMSVVSERNTDDLISDLKHQRHTSILAPVRLIAEDSLSFIRIDREIAGQGEWSGQLSEGFHLITTEKDGFESLVEYLEITDDSPREINLAVPKSQVGVLNLHGNLTDINVYLNGIKIGTTPFIMKNVKADELITLYFRKEGFKEKKMSIRPKRNDITDVFVHLDKD